MDNFQTRTTYRLLAALLGAVFLIALFASPGIAAPKSKLWPRWSTHDQASTQTVDHDDWTRLLQAYVRPSDDGVVRFDYAGLAGADRPALDGYIARLTAVPVSGLNRNEQLAYWINLYNALTIQVVLDHYPVSSILKINISPGFFSIGPWGKKLVSIEGEAVSLDDIEHRILRPIWRDPRIHYAVNCASIGCPNLIDTAYTADQVEAQLEANAIAYVNHPRGAELRGGALTVSNIYDWFQEDFGGSETGVLAHLRKYARPELARDLKLVSDIDSYAYDWSLNEAGS
tara:strand:+ start:199890 stop:200747 length:858 start_codon:yes stop_codon:yes gene_type:complete